MDRLAKLLDQNRGAGIVGLVLSFLAGGATLYAISTDLAIRALNAALGAAWFILKAVLAGMAEG